MAGHQEKKGARGRSLKVKKKGHKNQGNKHHEKGNKNENKPQILQTEIDVAKEKRNFSDPWEGVKP